MQQTLQERAGAQPAEFRGDVAGGGMASSMSLSQKSSGCCPGAQPRLCHCKLHLVLLHPCLPSHGVFLVSSVHFNGISG